jgi:hypothetical protein
MFYQWKLDHCYAAAMQVSPPQYFQNDLSCDIIRDSLMPLNLSYEIELIYPMKFLHFNGRLNECSKHVSNNAMVCHAHAGGRKEGKRRSSNRRLDAPAAAIRYDTAVNAVRAQHHSPVQRAARPTHRSPDRPVY